MLSLSQLRSIKCAFRINVFGNICFSRKYIHIISIIINGTHPNVYLTLKKLTIYFSIVCGAFLLLLLFCSSQIHNDFTRSEFVQRSIEVTWAKQIWLYCINHSVQINSCAPGYNNCSVNQHATWICWRFPLVHLLL